MRKGFKPYEIYKSINDYRETWLSPDDDDNYDRGVYTGLTFAMEIIEELFDEALDDVITDEDYDELVRDFGADMEGLNETR